MIETRRFIHLALVGAAVPVWLLLCATFVYDLMGSGRTRVPTTVVVAALIDADTLRSLVVAGAASAVAGALVGAALGTGRWWQAASLATRVPACVLVALPMACFYVRRLAVPGRGAVQAQAVVSPDTFVLLLPVVALAILVSARLAAAQCAPPN